MVRTKIVLGDFPDKEIKHTFIKVGSNWLLKIGDLTALQAYADSLGSYDSDVVRTANPIFAETPLNKGRDLTPQEKLAANNAAYALKYMSQKPYAKVEAMERMINKGEVVVINKVGGWCLLTDKDKIEETKVAKDFHYLDEKFAHLEDK